MKVCEMKIQTPRGIFNIHTEYESMDEAREAGWGLWFQHDNYLILGKENHCGAVVEL